MITIDRKLKTLISYIPYHDIIIEEYKDIFYGVCGKSTKVKFDKKDYYIKFIPAFDFIKPDSISLAYTNYFKFISLDDILQDLLVEFNKYKEFKYRDYGYIENNNMIIDWNFKSKQKYIKIMTIENKLLLEIT